MYSLLFFLFNLVCWYNYINPSSSSTFYVNNSYEIEWNFPDVNQNLTHIFLTHGDPFKLSKFSNNQMVLADVVFPSESAYNWTLPNDLNYYDIEDINWRILLSNSSTPYSSNIGSHSVQSIIYLSDFFSIQTNINISRVSDINLLYLNTLQSFTTNGFILNSSETPIEYKFILRNDTNSFELARFSSIPFNNQYLTIGRRKYTELSTIVWICMKYRLWFFQTPLLQINVIQVPWIEIYRIPIFLRITKLCW